MENNSQHIAISYHDVLLRNGFIEIPADDKINYEGGYMKMLSEGQAIFIDNRTDHWMVSHCNLIVQNADILKPLYLSKQKHQSITKRNKDVNNKSLEELNDFFLKMPMNLKLK